MLNTCRKGRLCSNALLRSSDHQDLSNGRHNAHPRDVSGSLSPVTKQRLSQRGDVLPTRFSGSRTSGTLPQSRLLSLSPMEVALLTTFRPCARWHGLHSARTMACPETVTIRTSQLRPVTTNLDHRTVVRHHVATSFTSSIFFSLRPGRTVVTNELVPANTRW